MKRMTWVPVLIGALLLVIALPIFAGDFIAFGQTNELQTRIETASWNTPTPSSAGTDFANETGYPGAGCELDQHAPPF